MNVAALQQNHWDMRRRVASGLVRSNWLTAECSQADHGVAMDAPERVPYGATNAQRMPGFTGDMLHVCGTLARDVVFVQRRLPF